jgi:hypothetical protein
MSMRSLFAWALGATVLAAGCSHALAANVKVES